MGQTKLRLQPQVRDGTFGMVEFVTLDHRECRSLPHMHGRSMARIPLNEEEMGA